MVDAGVQPFAAPHYGQLAMVIAIPTDDGVNVAAHPDRCGGFVVFEVSQSTAVRAGYRSNVCVVDGGGQHHAQGLGSGRMRAYQSLVAELSDCSALVSRGMDAALIRALRGGLIDAYGCGKSSVDEAARSFARGQLEKLEAGARDPPANRPGHAAPPHSARGESQDAGRE
ncbi:MAG: hypothetical protein HZB38_18420 [Planctomycetes bacterium]|nr:hypothetical protein [Planctomycetota bacterium]